MRPIKYAFHDPGNCRTYYRQGRRLICKQDHDPYKGKHTWYTCSRDGEPSHEISDPFKEPGQPDWRDTDENS